MLVKPMVQRLREARDVPTKLETALADVIALHGAERGNIQLVGTNGDLLIVRQSGLPLEFMQAFRRLSLDEATVCSRAARRGDIVSVPDVELDEDFRPWVGIARRVPFRSVVSAPIVDADHGCLGAVSVHFANRFVPSRLEMDSLATYCRELAASLTQVASVRELRESAEAMSGRLMDVARVSERSAAGV